MAASQPEYSAQDWESVLQAGVEAQRLVPEAIAVGGTAAALYAGHRRSMEVDHEVFDLTKRFTEIRETLEQTPHWKTAHVHAPKMILGAWDNIPVGFRQTLRKPHAETNANASRAACGANFR